MWGFHSSIVPLDGEGTEDDLLSAFAYMWKGWPVKKVVIEEVV